MIKDLPIAWIVLSLAVGWLLGAQLNCNSPIRIPEIVEKPTIIRETADTVVRTKIEYRDRWHVREVAARVENDTIRDSVTTPAYVASMDTVTATQDTINVAFRHPEQTFDLDYRPRPDSIRTEIVTKETIISIPDKRRWGIGAHIGAGIQQALDGGMRAGACVSVGVNFNLIEP